MNQHIISRIAIYLLAVVMIVFGIYHFRHPKELLIYIPAFVPGGIIWVYFVGGAFILAALAFITNRLVGLAGYLLAVLLLIFVLTVHLPNYLHSGDHDMRQIALVNLLKDTALAAFALYIASNARGQRVNEAV
jgi:putative oxidoreductase